MNAESTPISQGKKRELTSPEFDIELKKNKCVLSPFESDSELENSTDSSNNSTSETSGKTMASNVAPMEMASESSHILIPPSEMMKLSEMLKDTFRGEIVNLVSGVVDGVLKGLKTQISSLEKSNKDLVAENKSLISRLEVLEKRADQAEQYSRRNSLRISGFKEEGEENTDEIVLKLAADTGSDTQLTDIDRSHRVGNPLKKRSSPRDIIVKFATYRNRQKFYKQRTFLKESGYLGVFVNEDLTKFRSGILYEARKLVKAESVKGSWSSDGNILIKDKEDKVHRISSTDDLIQFGYVEAEARAESGEPPKGRRSAPMTRSYAQAAQASSSNDPNRQGPV